MHKVREYTYKNHKIKIEVKYPVSDWGSGSGKISNVAATGSITINVAGADGDRITANVNEGAGAFDIGTYVKQIGDTTDDIANGLSIDINSNTETHGYSSTSNTNVVAITASVLAGASSNTYILATVIIGTMTNTVVSFANGSTGTIANVYKVEMIAKINDNLFENLVDSQFIVSTRIGGIEEVMKQTIDTYIVQQALEVSTLTPLLVSAQYIDG